MKRSQILKLSLTAVLAFAVCMPGFAYMLGGKEMEKNGGASRTKYFIKVYYATLYVPHELKGAADTKIIEADKPMSLDVYISSSKVTKDKFVSSIAEAFDQSAKAGYATTDKQNYIDLFKDATIGEGDTVSHRYTPGKGLAVIFTSKGGQAKTLGVLKAFQTKKAFWGIFLSSKPIQDSLKKGLLGK